MRPACFRWHPPWVAPIALLAIAAVVVFCVLVPVDGFCRGCLPFCSGRPGPTRSGQGAHGRGDRQGLQLLAGRKVVVSVRGPVSTNQIGQKYVDTGSVEELTFGCWALGNNSPPVS